MSASRIDETIIRNVVDEVLRKLTGAAPAAGASCGCTAAPKPACGCSSRQSGGVFQDPAEAANAAQVAFEQLKLKGMAGRAKVVDIVKRICTAKAVEWGNLEFDETKIGRLEHKIEKLQGIKFIPGVEWLQPYGMSGDHGIAMEEHTAFGVIGCVTPVTHSIPTIACNIINIVAAGNTLVVNPHPNGARCAVAAVKTFNEAIKAELGIENIVTIIEKPTLESFEGMAKAEAVRVLCVTGGPGVVRAAMKSGKRAICAGPGNPPVLVDETARLDRAARSIIKGAAYDNNLLCIGEKEVFVVESVYRPFIEEMLNAGAVRLNEAQLERLTAAAFTFKKDGGGCSHPVLNRDLVGADARKLAEIAGLSVPANTEMLFAETDENHLMVVEEQMMPILPIVRVKDAEEGIAASVRAEHGYKHSAMIHSLNVERMTAMARAVDTTLFVKNGSCLAGLGNGGEGYASFSIATTTGEGITTPLTFTRTRRCVMVDNLRIW